MDYAEKIRTDKGDLPVMASAIKDGTPIPGLTETQKTVGELKQDLDEIKRSDETSYEPTLSDTTTYYNTSGATIGYSDVNGFTKSTGSSKSDNYAIPCVEGDVFYVTATGKGAGAYALIGALHPTYADVLSRGGVNSSVENEEVVIPEGCTYLIVNNYNVGNGSVKKVIADKIIYESDIKPLKDKVESLSKRCVADYDANNNQLNVYIPCEVGYVCLPMAFRTDMSTGHHYDVLHIQSAKAVDDAFATRYNLTATGEWECAIKLDGRSDFMGGTNHGDEINTSVSWFVDGEFVEDVTALANAQFDELVCVCLSDLYDPSNETTIVAKHAKKYTFTKDGLDLKQSVNWLANETIKESYLCMMPILDYTSSTKTIIITQHGYADDTFEIFNLFNSDNDDIHKWIRNRSEICTFGKEKGLSVTTKKISEIVNDGITHGGYACIYSTMTKSGSNGYNKHYYAVAGLNGNDTVNVGDIWKSEYLYQFEVGK